MWATDGLSIANSCAFIVTFLIFGIVFWFLTKINSVSIKLLVFKVVENNLKAWLLSVPKEKVNKKKSKT